MKWCGHHLGFVLAVGRIQPMLELFETGSILGVILVPLFTMQYIAQVSLAYWYSAGMTILRSRVRIPVVALSVLGHNLDSHNLDSRNLDPHNLGSHNLDLPQPRPDIT